MADNLAILSTSINDDLDKKFRKAIGSRMGNKKGHIQTALEEAITAWLEGPKSQETKYDLVKTFRPSHKNDPSKGGVLGAPKDFIGWECGITKLRKIE